MTDSSRSTRRRFLRLTGGGAVVGLAGCTAPGSDSQSSPTSTPTPSSDSTTTSASGDGNGSSENGSSENGSHGHGGGDHGHGSASLDGPKKSAEVAMATTNEGTHFEPHVVWVESSGTVTWKLESGAHSTTAYAPANGKPRRIPKGASAWDSGTLTEAGKVFERTFEVEGVYDYFCIPHEASGMLGSVIVGRPDPSGQAALAPPQSDLPSGARKKSKSLNERVRSALGGHH